MPAAIWTGSLSLGMVVVPVRLYPAVRKKSVHFHELDRRGRRIRHIRISEPDADWLPPSPATTPRPSEDEHRAQREYGAKFEQSDRPPPMDDRMSTAQIEYGEIRKGYEVAPGEYISLTREEVAEMAPERSRVIDVQQFVDVTAVDPIYFESRYYVVPGRDWADPFRLLHQAMSVANRMAIAWFTLRSRRYLSAVRPYGEVMLLTTMVHADEIAPADFWIPQDISTPTEKELKMAKLLIETLSGPFEPERYPDEHRQRVLKAIEAKTPIGTAPEPSPSPTQVIDLMAALEASVKAAKAARTDENRQRKPGRKSSA